MQTINKDILLEDPQAFIRAAYTQLFKDNEQNPSNVSIMSNV